MPKRSNDDINIKDLIESIDRGRGLVDELLELNRDELAAVLAHIANEASIPTAIFKKARVDLPSFSATKWSGLASQFGLSQKVSQVDLDTFKTPKYHLPLSLHETMFENAWRWQDVYQEKVDQTKEEACVRILDPYIIPILALFQGRVIDMPEEAMPESKYSTGGEVEHEISMIGGILLFIKLGKPNANALAHLFLEFLSAAEMNKTIDFAGLRIYGLLTDLICFKFYSYDPITNKFCFDETIIINNRRIDAFSDMMDVSNKIFGVILSAYIDGLQAIKKKRDMAGRKNTADNTESSSQKSPPEPPGEGNNTSAAAQREAALMFAERCRAKLEEQVVSLPDIEEKALEALALLTRSACSMPRASPFTGGDDNPSKPAELKLLATRVTNEAHERYFS